MFRITMHRVLLLSLVVVVVGVQDSFAQDKVTDPTGTWKWERSFMIWAR